MITLRLLVSWLLYHERVGIKCYFIFSWLHWMLAHPMPTPKLGVSQKIHQCSISIPNDESHCGSQMSQSWMLFSAEKKKHATTRGKFAGRPNDGEISTNERFYTRRRGRFRRHDTNTQVQQIRCTPFFFVSILFYELSPPKLAKTKHDWALYIMLA